MTVDKEVTKEEVNDILKNAALNGAFGRTNSIHQFK
jgi:hypothetical protein